MTYTFRCRVLGADGKITLDSEKIDVRGWLAYLQAHTTRYGNLHEFIAAALPALKDGDANPLIAASIAAQIDEAFADHEPTLIAQYALCCWEAFQAGELGAGAWGAALGYAWQGSGAALAETVALPESLVVRMFETADKEALYRVGAQKKDWAAYIAGLPETVEVYRGISTASTHRETGFSWSTDPEAAKRCSARHVRKASDIPGVIRARVAREALLGAFDGDSEVVLHPAAERLDLTTTYLSGSGLTKFRQNWKKWQAEEAKRRTGEGR